MRHAGAGVYGARLRALIVVLWRAGLLIHEALALGESDLDQRRGSLLVRRGKGGRRREVGIDDWAWEQLQPWLTVRVDLPVGPLFWIATGRTCGRAWSPGAARTELRLTDPDERGKAFGIFGAIGVGGGAIGLLLGGALTEYISWRWCLYINIAIAVPAGISAVALLRDQARNGDAELDIPGTITACLGLVALVYGFSQAETDGWGGASTLGFIAVGLVLLAVFVAVQRRVAHPLLPLRVVLDRNRGGAFLVLATNSAGLLAVFLFLTYYLQPNLGLSPLQTGLAFLPPPIFTAIGAMQAATRLAARFGARPVITVRMAVAAVGMVLLAQLDAESSYLTGVLPGLVVMSLGLGCVMGLAMGNATFGVDPADAGVAGAAVNTMQQVGGSLGTALLSALAVSATADTLAGAPRTPELVARGYTTAFWCSAALLVVGAVLSWVLSKRDSALAHSDTTPAQPVVAH
jgi:MFS family permease